MLNKIYEKIKNFIKENYIGIIIVGVVAFVSFYELPFAIYAPGGIVALEKRITVDGGYSSEGSINMSYVSMVKSSILMTGLSYIIPDWDLVPESDVTGNQENMADLITLQKLYMDQSINNATLVAYEKANKQIEIASQTNHIIYFSDQADTDLQMFDELLSVEGTPITEVAELRSIVAQKNVGDKVSLQVKRNGKERTCTAKIYQDGDDLLIGVAFLTTYEFTTNPTIDITRKSSESGPSGGLMFTLAIYNSLVSDDITKGRVVVGTGTIDAEGNIGAIDGIKYKLLGAKKGHADIYLCPQDNYEEAISVKKEYNLNFEIYAVKTFDAALEILAK